MQETPANELRTSPRRIEDYALIGDCETAALVGRDGSIDWLCWPRFDSGACFAAILGRPEHGRWLIAPKDSIVRVGRKYLNGSLILLTAFETEQGIVELIDFMRPRNDTADLIRLVRGVSGHVDLRTEFILRFDYGSVVPWMERLKGGGGLRAIAGPEMAVLRTPVHLHGRNFTTVGEFTVGAQEVVPFVLSYGESQSPPPPQIDPLAALQETEAFWQEWSERCAPAGEWTGDVRRSLVILKGLTYAPTGGMVAAPTTSLPEQAGGVRNWDYRYCWLRDATFTLQALGTAGYTEEAKEWRDWLLRAVAGRPDQLQIMYGLGGERRLPEWEVPWLSGFEGARPVRVGNAAAAQLQLDVYGEIADAMFQARSHGVPPAERWSAIARAFLDHLEIIWCEPDEGIWEVRGPRQHFTHSKVMAWVAFDRAVKAVEQLAVERSSAGGRLGTPFMRMFVATRSTTNLAVSCRPTDRKRWTPVFSCLRSSVSCRRLIRELWEPCGLSRLVCWWMDSSSAMTPTKRKTVCRPARRPSSHAASGLWTISCFRVALRKRARCSSGYLLFATMSDCLRRSMIRPRFARWEIFRRRSATSRSSIRHTISPGTKDRPNSVPSRMTLRCVNSWRPPWLKERIAVMRRAVGFPGRR
jgi:hypothetical protein